MEFLLVVFDEERDVFVDEKIQGKTNLILEIQKGTQTVHLSYDTPLPDYTPEKMKIVLEDTTVLNPKEVRFEKI